MFNLVINQNCFFPLQQQLESTIKMSQQKLFPLKELLLPLYLFSVSVFNTENNCLLSGNTVLGCGVFAILRKIFEFLIHVALYANISCTSQSLDSSVERGKKNRLRYEHICFCHSTPGKGTVISYLVILFTCSNIIFNILIQNGGRVWRVEMINPEFPFRKSMICSWEVTGVSTA